MLNVEQLKIHLATLDDRMFQWAHADEEIFQQLNRQGMPIGEIVQAVVESRQERVLEGYGDPREQLFALLDDVTEDYLTAESELRGAIRGAFNGKDRVLYGVSNYIARAAEHVKSQDDESWLRRGLAAASILDGRLDEQDTMINLGRLYRAAAQAGIEPQPHFEAIASLSSGAYAGRQGSTRSVLERFHETDYFRQSVAPEL